MEKSKLFGYFQQISHPYFVQSAEPRTIEIGGC